MPELSVRGYSCIWCADGHLGVDCPDRPGDASEQSRSRNMSGLREGSVDALYAFVRRDPSVTDEELRAAINDPRCQTHDEKHIFDLQVFGGSCTVCGRSSADLV